MWKKLMNPFPSDMGRLGRDIILTMGVILIVEYAIKAAEVYSLKYAACKVLGLCVKATVV